MARYHPISARFWSDPQVRLWSDEARLLALYLLTCRHRSLEGLYLLPPEYIAADLGWPVRKVNETLEHLEQEGFVAIDADAQVVLVRNALKYQPPKGAKQITGALSTLEQLPDTRLVGELVHVAETHAKPLADALSKRYPTPPDTPSIPHRPGIRDRTPPADTPSNGNPELESPTSTSTSTSNSEENTTVEPTRLDQAKETRGQRERQVFEAWITATDRTDRTVFDDKRRRLIRRALDKFPLADVVDAVRGWRHSPHHRGENASATRFNDLELLLRDSAHIEKFRDLERANPGEDTSTTAYLDEHPCSEDPDAHQEWRTVLQQLDGQGPAAFLIASHPHSSAADGPLLIGVKPESLQALISRSRRNPQWLDTFTGGRRIEFLACPSLERSAA